MKKITIIFISVLMIFASCSMDTSYDDSNEIEEKTNTEKEDDTENNTDEPSNEELKEDDTENNEDESSNEKPKEDEPSNEEDNSENGDVENKTWCEIDEDINILGLNYFVCVDNSQTKLNPSTNDESQVKNYTYLIRGYASKYIEIRVRYNNKKLNFSSVSDSYTITNVMKKDSTINITIEWK